MKKMNISLAYKKDKRISQARLTLSEDLANFLAVNESEKKVKIIYSAEDEIIRISKTDEETIDNIKKEEKNKLIFFQTVKEIAIEKTTKGNKDYYTKKLFIPLPIINALEITGEDSSICIIKSENELHLIKEKNENKKKE